MIRASGWWRPAVLAIALALVTAGCTTTAVEGAASMASSTSASTEDRIERSDAWLADATQSIKPGCSAAAGIDGDVVWAGATGLAQIDSMVPLTTDTRFDIGAVANQFTATAILLLAQEGRLALTDPLSAHLLDMPAWADRVSIEHLLHQTSGIREVWPMMSGAGFTSDNPASQQDALGVLKQVRELNFDPGSVSEFADSNYLLLAEAVHAVSGQALPEFLQERVFGPLGLDMVFRSDARGEIAVNYEDILGQLKPAGFTGWLMAGPGFVLTTPSDLVRWADNYRTGAVGGRDLLHAVEGDGMPVGSSPDASRYGAGIYNRTDGSIEHDGWIPGGRSYLSVSSDRHTAVAFSCNQESSQDRMEKLIVGLRTIWFGMP